MVSSTLPEKVNRLYYLGSLKRDLVNRSKRFVTDLETGKTYTLVSVIDLNRKINSVRDDIRASFA